MKLVEHVIHRLRQEPLTALTLKSEARYLAHQCAALFYRELHLIAESKQRRRSVSTSHAAIDYHDSPGDVIVACLCGKEWS